MNQAPSSIYPRHLSTSTPVNFATTTIAPSGSTLYSARLNDGSPSKGFSQSESGIVSESDLVSLLSNNPELLLEDVRNEIRWIRDEVRQRSSEMLRKGRLPPVEDELVRDFVERRSKGEPLQYILGSTDFGPMTIKCVRPVLIPRPETAHCTTLLSDRILSTIPRLTSASRPSNPMDVLDLCTGSGCIALLLARLNPLLRVTGVDNSPAAVALGMANAKALELDDRVAVRYGNLFASSTGGLLPDSGSTGTKSAASSPATNHRSMSPRARFLASEFVDQTNANSISTTASNESSAKRKVGLVVSNPPYIPYEEWKSLPASVREYESPSALLGDGDITKGNGRLNLSRSVQGKGLKYYERIAEILPDLLIDQEMLEKDGWVNVPRLALEVGKGQAQDVQDIVLRQSGGMIRRTEIWKDQFGVERFVVGWTK
ncbi:hypothetical protein IAT40_000534 [Kwoniella sp. CBS 6097]